MPIMMKMERPGKWWWWWWWRWKDLESDRTNNSVANNQATNANLTRADGEQEVDQENDKTSQCSSSYWLWSSWCLRSFPKWCSTWVNMNWITALQASFNTCTLQIIFDIKFTNSKAISIHRFQKSFQDFYASMQWLLWNFATCALSLLVSDDPGDRTDILIRIFEEIFCQVNTARFFRDKKDFICTLNSIQPRNSEKWKILKEGMSKFWLI